MYLFLLIHQHRKIIFQNQASLSAFEMASQCSVPDSQHNSHSLLRYNGTAASHALHMLSAFSADHSLTYTDQVEPLATACPPSRSIKPILDDAFFCSELPHLANVSKDSPQLAFHQFQLILIAISARCHMTEHIKCQSILL